ncbi:MAG: hypothetical protein HY814_11385 [Candidatus Riflebacteria bacterium]|nr:hypothetical protein [Candidatus Riflebacteria bacterium]
MKQDIAFGIDFGMTTTAVVGIRDGQVTKYGDEGEQPFRSVVAIDRVTGQINKWGARAWGQTKELAET